MGMFPLNTSLYGNIILGESSKTAIPISEFVKSLGVVLVPVCIGGFIRAKSEKIAKTVEKVGAVTGVLAIITILIGGFTDKKNLQKLRETQLEAYLAAFFLGLFGMVLGYALSRAGKLDSKDARTVSLETGIQNVILTIAIIEFAYGKRECEMNDVLTIPYLYALMISLLSPLSMAAFRWGLPNVEVESSKVGVDR